MLAIKDFEGVIFDFDGTLVDASQAIGVSFNVVHRKEGIPVMADDEVRAMIGRPLREMFSYMFPDAGPGKIRAYVEKYRQVFHPVSLC